AVWDEKFRVQLLRMIARREHWKGHGGDLIGSAGSALNETAPDVLGSHILGAEQSNSSMLFENKFFLKLYRKLEDGLNPDVEVTRFLTERAKFPNVPAFGGAIEYRRGKSQPSVVCVLQSAIATEGDAWTLTLDSLGRYY